MKLLEEAGLINNVKTVINLQGNEEKFYECSIQRIAVDFEKGRLSVKVEPKEIDKFVRLWKRFSAKKL